MHDGIQDIGKFGETIQGMLYNGNADVDIHEVRIIVLIYIKNTFSSNHNVQKTLWSLCLLALTLQWIDISKFYQLNSLEPNKGRKNFYDCSDLMKKYIKYSYLKTVLNKS